MHELHVMLLRQQRVGDGFVAPSVMALQTRRSLSAVYAALRRGVEAGLFERRPVEGSAGPRTAYEYRPVPVE